MKKFIPPTLAEVYDYITEKGYKVDAEKFMEYFTVGDWIDSKGNKVRNWKQKIITWSGGEKVENKSCVICRNKGTSFQMTKDKKVWLCDECKRYLGGNWGGVPLAKLERIIEQNKSRIDKRLSQPDQDAVLNQQRQTALRGLKKN
ncbi:hypothetical protein LCGC14_0376180 [marine sediment metagenome]|uniref:Uncharacterized protein n=1 Tax=marine sediment metagenome TaxID=412755 RepID=A0A0F9T3V8_9ZZZZ